MSDLIDRVAMAIAAAIDDGTFYNAPAFQKAARAAIEAMREPSNAMHKAGNDEMDAMAVDGRALCEHIWCAMVDAALQDHAPPQIGMDWKMSGVDCCYCKGHGRIGIMACMKCGATGRADRPPEPHPH